MEKLELKHLAGYLPFGVLVTKEDWDNYLKMVVEHKDIYDLEIKDVLRFQAKPILRPLSDLKKEIEVNGEKFVPMGMLCSIEVSEEEAFKLYGKIPEIWKYISETKTRYWYFWQVQKLFEWHFDVYGLIEKGLAIDVNTLPDNTNF